MDELLQMYVGISWIRKWFLLIPGKRFMFLLKGEDTDMVEKRLVALKNETKAHFLFRNICALLTVLIAVYFLYNALGFNIEADSWEELGQVTAEDMASEVLEQGFDEVMMEDYGIETPKLINIDFIAILDVILLVACIALCVLSNWVGKGPAIHFFRTSVIATCMAVAGFVLSSTMFSVISKFFSIGGSMANDAAVEVMSQMDDTEIFAAIVIVMIVMLIALIPAYIASNKNHSFKLFYILSLFAFVPMFIIALIIGDKYEEKYFSDKGIKLIIGGIITFILTANIIEIYGDKAGEFVQSVYPYAMETEHKPEVIILILVLFVAAIIPSIIVSCLVLLVLNKPIAIFTGAFQARKKPVRRYTGKNAYYVNQIMEAIPIASKYKYYLNKRDRLASFRRLDIDGVMRIAVVPTIIYAMLALYFFPVLASFIPAMGSEGKFNTAFYVYSILVIFLILVVFSLPIAKLNVKRSEKMDKVIDNKGYIREIREKLPDFSNIPNENISHKKLCYMNTMYRVVEEGTRPEDVSKAVSLVSEGVSFAKIIVSAAAIIMVLKKAGDIEEKLL